MANKCNFHWKQKITENKQQLLEFCGSCTKNNCNFTAFEDPPYPPPNRQGRSPSPGPDVGAAACWKMRSAVFSLGCMQQPGTTQGPVHQAAYGGPGAIKTGVKIPHPPTSLSTCLPAHHPGACWVTLKTSPSKETCARLQGREGGIMGNEASPCKQSSFWITSSTLKHKRRLQETATLWKWLHAGDQEGKNNKVLRYRRSHETWWIGRLVKIWFPRWFLTYLKSSNVFLCECWSNIQTIFMFCVCV